MGRSREEKRELRGIGAEGVEHSHGVGSFLEHRWR